MECSNTYLEGILKHAQDGILIVDEQDRVLLCNSSIAMMFESDREEIIGTPVASLAEGQWLNKVTGLLQRVRREKSLKNLELECITATDRAFYVETSFDTISDTDLDSNTVLMIVHDITHRKYNEDQLRMSNERLEQSNIELEQFAYIASHDLQSPLRNIIGFVQLLQSKYQEKLDKEALEWIDYIVQSATHMKTMIDSLLTYSRVDSRALPFIQVDLNDLMEVVVNILRSSIDDAQAQIEYARLPVVFGDQSQLTQLMMNLIGNAIKYRSEEPPRIYVSVSENDEEWQIAVKDNGIGIPDKHRERVFEIFRRLHTTKTYPGTGIGLSICKRIVSRHGGRIWVESQPGSGSTFYFTVSKN